MSWIYVLGIVVVLVALAALSGLKPDDTKPVRNTRLMTAAKIALGVAVVVLAWLVLRSYGVL